MEPSKQIRAVAQTYLQEQQLKEQAEYIAVLESTIVAIAEQLGVEPQQLINEVSSQLTGAMLQKASQGAEAAEAKHTQRAERYDLAGKRVSAAMAAGTKPNPDDVEINPTGGTKSNFMANVRRGTPLPTESLGKPEVNIGERHAALKAKQAGALHDIARGRESGDMGLQQKGKQALRSLAPSLAGARRERGEAKKK